EVREQHRVAVRGEPLRHAAEVRPHAPRVHIHDRRRPGPFARGPEQPAIGDAVRGPNIDPGFTHRSPPLTRASSPGFGATPEATSSLPRGQRPFTRGFARAGPGSERDPDPW